VDIGEVIRPADVVPVVIKSLIFPGAAAAVKAGEVAYAPIRTEAASAPTRTKRSNTR
jgi:hypothetical protein